MQDVPAAFQDFASTAVTEDAAFRSERVSAGEQVQTMWHAGSRFSEKNESSGAEHVQGHSVAYTRSVQEDDPISVLKSFRGEGIPGEALICTGMGPSMENRIKS